MRLYRLDLGEIGGSARIFDASAELGRRVVFPVSAYLVELDDGRNVLFDAGVYPGGIRADMGSYRFQAQGQTLERQLELCGHRPGDIDAVVLSHLHYDHAGYLFLLADRDVFVNPAEHAHAFSNPGGAYCARDYDVGVTRWRFVEDDRMLFPGIEAVQLPGHTVGHMGLLVRLASGPVLLAQDALYSAANDYPTLAEPGILYDRAAYRRSLAKMRALRSNDASLRVFYGHDVLQVVRSAPELYE